jgi:hypothetical protein
VPIYDYEEIFIVSDKNIFFWQHLPVKKEMAASKAAADANYYAGTVPFTKVREQKLKISYKLFLCIDFSR